MTTPLPPTCSPCPATTTPLPPSPHAEHHHNLHAHMLTRCNDDDTRLKPVTTSLPPPHADHYSDDHNDAHSSISIDISRIHTAFNNDYELIVPSWSKPIVDRPSTPLEVPSGLICTHQVSSSPVQFATQHAQQNDIRERGPCSSTCSSHTHNI